MKFSRRRLLLGASTLAICAATSADAFWHGSAATVFNNGKSQVQSWDPSLAGDFPFINLMKISTQWQNADNTGQTDPNILDANGYPTSNRTNGYVSQVNIPGIARSGETIVITWSGNGTLELQSGGIGTFTPVSGSLTSTTGTGRYAFTTTETLQINFLIRSFTSPYISNIQMFYLNDETALNAGQIFGVKFLQILRQGNPGVIRFMDWTQLNVSNATTWATRKPTSYYSYTAQEFRTSLNAGVTTSSGVKYAATLGSGAPTDKQTVHVTFNSTPISMSIGANATVTWGASSPVAHGLNIGQSFQFATPSGTALPSPVSAGTTYWVTGVPTSSTLTFSATKGGANINTTGGTLTGAPVAWAFPVQQSGITISNATSAVVSWTNHGLSIGDAVNFNTSIGPNGMPTPYLGINIFYVIATGFGTNSFQVSTAPGGTAINTAGFNVTACTSGTNQPTLTIPGHNFAVGGFITPSGLGGLTNINGQTLQITVISGNNVSILQPSGSVTGTYTSGGTAVPAIQGSVVGFGVSTLNLNATTAYPILSPSGSPNTHDGGGPFAGTTVTLVFDAGMNGWLMFGGQGANTGLACGIPPEICVALCTAIGAHPHFVVPCLASDPMTDFVPQLANYVKTTAPSWMKPRFEPPNELWNVGFYPTGYASNKASFNFGASFYNNYGEWYGKVTSTIGQAVNAIYGGTPSSQTAYAILCAIQTDSAGSNSNDPRLTAPAYVNQSAAAQTLVIPSLSLTINFTKSAAFNWATHSCLANYWSPGERGTPLELIDAYNWWVTNNGNPSAQATIAASYVGTANNNTTINGSPSDPFNLVALKAMAVACQAWAAAFGVTKMCGYEGCYSPDYFAFAGDGSDAVFTSVISGISNAASASIIVGVYNSDGAAGTGAGVVVGMPISIRNATGMTQINSPALQNVTITAGTPGTIVYGSAHGLSAGQAVYFLPEKNFGPVIPTPVIPGQVYYVLAAGLTSTQYEIALTPGGTAINISGTQVGIYRAQPCYVVTGTTANGSGAVTSFTINVNSSAFGVYTANSAQLVYGGSVYNLTQLRQAGKFVPSLQTYTVQLYTDFAAAGGEFPSQYTISGTTVVWTAWDPTVYLGSTPPEWAGITTFNH